MLTETDRRSFQRGIRSRRPDDGVSCGVFVIDYRKHDVPLPGFNRAVNHKHITIVDVRTYYGIADYAEKKCCRLIAHQLGIEIEAF